MRTAATIAQPLFHKLGLLDEPAVVSSTSGKKTKMGGGFNEISALDILYRFFSQKENPIVSFMTKALAQKDEAGKPINVGKEVTERIAPMVAQDFYDLYKQDHDLFKMAVLGTLSLFGAGVQTYPPKTPKEFVGQNIKTREQLISGETGADPIAQEFIRLGVRPTIDRKTIGPGEPVPPDSMDALLKMGGDEMRRIALFYINNPAYKTASDEQKKKWLQKAADTGWRITKTKYKAGVK